MLVVSNSGSIVNTWRSGLYVGNQRPITRVTIQWATQRDYSHKGWTYRSIPLNQVDAGQEPRELPNVKSCRIVRSIDQDAATVDLTFYNVKPLPIGAPIPTNWKMLPGWYSPSHASNPLAGRWGYTDKHWQDWLVPDRIVRVYQGYGVDRTVTPDKDPHLVLTGTFIADDIEFTHDKLINLTGRDLAEALIEQDCYKPVVPASKYPVLFTSIHTVPAVTAAAYKSKVGNGSASFDTDSNFYWDADGVIYGHKGQDAFDASSSSYWLSIGNALPDASWSYEWVQGKFHRTSVNAVRFKPKWGNYRVYVSVYANGSWQGANTIPYAPAGVGAPNGSAIPYVKHVTCGWETEELVELPQTYDKVTKVRLTFTNLHDSGLGPYPYRAALRDFDVLNTKRTRYTKTISPAHKVGNYGDYTEIVKLFCAIGGFYWPNGAHVLQGGPVTSAYSSVPVQYNKNDPYLGLGRVWGDFEMSGTSGPLPIPASAFDKKSLMDCVTYIKEILGFHFGVDENGGVIFRSPNLWKVGNFVNVAGQSDYRRTFVRSVHVIDEREVLVSYGAKLSNKNKRSSIYIGTVDGKIGARIAGTEEIPAKKFPLKLIKLAMWTDQHFDSLAECKTMAELVKIRQMLTYRVGKVRIPANPAIQVDDQARIVERVTGEGYIHYISGITSTFDAESGRWQMDLDTFWLGSRTFGDWVFNPKDFDKSTQELLEKQGHI